MKVRCVLLLWLGVNMFTPETQEEEESNQILYNQCLVHKNNHTAKKKNQAY